MERVRDDVRRHGTRGGTGKATRPMTYTRHVTITEDGQMARRQGELPAVIKRAPLSVTILDTTPCRVTAELTTHSSTSAASGSSRQAASRNPRQSGGSRNKNTQVHMELSCPKLVPAMTPKAISAAEPHNC